MQMFILRLVKRVIRKIWREIYYTTKLYQKKKANDFFHSPKYERLNPKDRTPCRIIYGNKDKTRQLKRLFENVSIKLDKNKRFQHWIDTGLYCFNTYTLNGECPPNYEIILKKSIDDLLEENIKKRNTVERNNYNLLKVIKKYIIRIIDECEKQSIDSTFYKRMISDKTSSLEEALQRIIFYSSLFWQTGHSLIGIGRLDKILAEYLQPDTEEQLIQLICDFYETMHEFYEYKSNALLGDTGQLIILGGIEPNGTYFCNNLTYVFIKALIKYNKPDPKILLRVSKNMPDDLLDVALNSIKSGNGSPLLSNDDIVVPSLIKFGYSDDDAYNYVTSACWEPFCYGKSIGNQNLGNINYAKCIVETIKDSKFLELTTFAELKKLFFEKLDIEVNFICRNVSNWKFEKNPLMSLFTETCKVHGKDISNGGAKYNDTGILSVGLANAIDSLFAIKKLSFAENKYSLEKLRNCIIHNYEANEQLQNELKELSFFGTDDSEIIATINEIQVFVSNIVSRYKNKQGGKLRFGLSSPNYMSCGEEISATLDGRKANEPLSVHISCKKNVAYTQLVNFASRLDYVGNKCNGNVLDYFVAPCFIDNNFDKFLLFIRASIINGFFQMQMNVVSSETLLAAKKNPSLFPNLIVRVWGFSAYFNDLPENYKDLLIRRAIESERVA